MLPSDDTSTYVVDLGARYIKLAAARDARPRLLLRLKPDLADVILTGRDRAAITAALEPSLRRVLLAMPPVVHTEQQGSAAAKKEAPVVAGGTDRGAVQVVVLASPVTNPDAVAAVVAFFHDAAAIPSVCVKDSLPPPLRTAGLSSGVVVDVGYGGTRCGVVLHGIRESRAVAFSPRGGRTVLTALRQRLLTEHGKAIGRRSVTETELEDVLLRGACVAPPHPARTATFDYGGDDGPAEGAAAASPAAPAADAAGEEEEGRAAALALGVPLLMESDIFLTRPIAALESLFAEPDDDSCPAAAAADAALFPDAGLATGFPKGPALPVVVAQALLACPTHLRADAVRSLVIVGGLSDVPNLRRRLVEGVVSAIQHRPEFAALRPLLAELEGTLVALVAPYTGAVAAVMGAAMAVRPATA